MFIKISMATSTTNYPCDQKTLNINADTKKTKSLADLARDALKQASLKEKPAPIISYEEINVSDPKAPIVKLPKETMLHIFSYLNPDKNLAICKGLISYKTEASFSATWILKALNEGKTNKALTLIQNEHLDFNSKNLEGLWRFITNRYSPAFKVDDFDFNKIEMFVKNAILKHPDLLSNEQLLRAASYFGLVNFIPNILREPSSKQPLPLSQECLDDALAFACQENHLEIAKLLLIDKRANPVALDNHAIHLASQNGHFEIIRLLLADNRVNPAEGNSFAIFLASRNGRFETVRLLLADIRVNPADRNNRAIREASGNGHFEIVRLLLTDIRVNPADLNNDAINSASQNGHLEVVRLLLADNRVNPAAGNNYAIRFASRNGHFDTVRLLLADNRVNPADGDNNAIRFASENGHLEVVRLLLGDNRVNPADGNNAAIRGAILQDHPEVVRLLLADSRMYVPASYKEVFLNTINGGYSSINGPNEMLSLAIQYNCFDVVKVLLADSRTNPANCKINEESAIECAIDRGYSEMVKILLADSRVAIPRNALKLVLEKKQAANISLDDATKCATKWAANIFLDEATKWAVRKKNYQDIIELLDYHTHLNDLSFNILMTNAVSRLTSGLVAGSGLINSVYQRTGG